MTTPSRSDRRAERSIESSRSSNQCHSSRWASSSRPHASVRAAVWRASVSAWSVARYRAISTPPNVRATLAPSTPRETSVAFVVFDQAHDQPADVAWATLRAREGEGPKRQEQLRLPPSRRRTRA